MMRTEPTSARLRAVLCSLLLLPGPELRLMAQNAPATPVPATADSAVLPPEQIDSLVSPIALFPDPLLSQVLVASTYPLELVEAKQWIEQNAGKDTEALVQAAKAKDWDPSVQAMAAFPDLVKRLAGDIRWTTDLGNAFLAQQADVMDGIQRMRKKAKDAGKLESTKEQEVEMKVEDDKQVIVVQPANPQVIYVPTYNPTVVWGPPIYPYPPIYYPPPPTGAIVAASVIAFGAGIALGAAFGGCCGWGWGCSWGRSNTVIIHNSYFVHNNYHHTNNVNIRNTNINNWQHDSVHRQGVPYQNRQTADKYKGFTREDMRNPQTRQKVQRDAQSRLAGSAGSGGISRPSQGRITAPQARPTRSMAGAGDKMGNRSIPKAHNNSGGAFGGLSGGGSHMQSNRGHSGMSSARGGGFKGGGGGARRGGGRRR